MKNPSAREAKTVRKHFHVPLSIPTQAALEERSGAPQDLVEYFSSLSHVVRLRILLLVYENVEMTYSEILDALQIDEGLLNFHLRKMKGFLSQTKNGYALSDRGESAIKLMAEARKHTPTAETVFPSPRNLTMNLVARRIIAFLVDALSFFFATGVFLDKNVNLLLSSLASMRVSMQLISEMSYETAVHWSHLFFAAYIAFTVLEAYKGQTLGKWVCRIRVVSVSGTRITLLDSAIRNIGKVFLLPVDLLAGIILFSRRGYLCFFDYYTRTTVETVVKID